MNAKDSEGYNWGNKPEGKGCLWFLIYAIVVLIGIILLIVL